MSEEIYNRSKPSPDLGLELANVSNTVEIENNVDGHVNDTNVHDAAYIGDLRTLQYIAETSTERLFETDEDGAQGTHYAALGGHLECLQFLLDRGLDPYKKDTRFQNTILFKAIVKGRENIVDYICNTFPKLLNERCNKQGKTPLHQAIWSTNGDSSIFECLVKHGADMSKRDYEHRTIFHHAAYLGSEAILNYALHKCREMGSLIDLSKSYTREKGYSACHSATSTGELNCLKLLIKHGFDPFGRSKKGHTILQTAAMSGSFPIIIYLCENYPEMIHMTDSRGETSLHSAVYGGSLDCLKYLILQGIDVRKRSKNGNTLLHQAAVNGHLEIARYLCENYDNLKDTFSNNNETALHFAVKGNHIDVLKYLLDQGVDANWRNKWAKTILDLAIEQGKNDIVEYLKDKETDAVK